MTWTVLKSQDAAQITLSDRFSTVGLNAFAVADDTMPGLLTRDVQGCTGIALLPLKEDGKPALIHVFAKGDFLKEGEDKVIQHARNVWTKFAASVEPGSYEAVIFGGTPHDADDNGKVSHLIGNTLFECAKKSELISKLDDMRYQDSRPVTAIINAATRQIAIGDDIYFNEIDVDPAKDAKKQQHVFGQHSLKLHA